MNSNYRILLIEDFPSDAYLIQRELKKNLPDHEFRVTDNLEDFLSILMTFTPDIVLSDYSLPGFDWRIAFRTIKEKLPGTPFLLVTSSTNPTIIENCLLLGIQCLISKDNLEPLVPAILNLLKKS